ncbi:hypothetical protein Tsubulata_026947, partial [Turnera subulata]
HLLPRDAATKPRRHRRPRRLRSPPYNSSVTPSPPTPSPVLAVPTSPPPFATATTAAIISPLRLAPLPRLSLVITELGNGDMGWIENFLRKQCLAGIRRGSGSLGNFPASSGMDCG